MQKSKIIHYFSFLDKKEAQSFQNFVHSPYFNKHENTRRFVDYLLTAKAKKLTKEKVFAHVFPDKKFDEQLLSNLSSYALRLLKKFYAQQHFEQSETAVETAALDRILQSGQERLFSLYAGRLEKKSGKTERRDSRYYLQKSKLALLFDDFNLQYGDRKNAKNLEAANSHFDTYFIGEKLKMMCRTAARRQVTGQDFSYTFRSEIFAYLAERKEIYAQIPSVWIYFLICKMLTEDIETHYFDLKKRLPQTVKNFQKEEGRDLYTHLLNYCVRRLNLGNSAFRKEAFDIYRQMLAQGLLYRDGILPQWDFTNMVSLGCDLAEYAATRNFIFAEKSKLADAERENTFTYNLAAFHYSQKEYAAAVELLQKVEFTDVYYNLLNRILTLKIHYEQSNDKALDYTSETFRIFLLRNKNITQSRRKSGLNLIRFTKNLSQLRSEKGIVGRRIFEEKVRALQEKIEGTEAVLNRGWLLERTGEMG